MNNIYIYKYFTKYLFTKNYIKKQIYLHKMLKYYKKRQLPQIGGKISPDVMSIIVLIEKRIKDYCKNKFNYQIIMPRVSNINIITLNQSLTFLLIAYILYGTNIVKTINNYFYIKFEKNNINPSKILSYLKITYQNIAEMFIDPKPVIINIALQTFNKNIVNLNTINKKLTDEIEQLLKKYNIAETNNDNIIQKIKDIISKYDEEIKNINKQIETIDSKLEILKDKLLLFNQQYDNQDNELNIVNTLTDPQLIIKQNEILKEIEELQKHKNKLKNDRTPFINDKHPFLYIIKEYSKKITEQNNNTKLINKINELIIKINNNDLSILPIDEIIVNIIEVKKMAFTVSELKYIYFIISYLIWCNNNYNKTIIYKETNEASIGLDFEKKIYDEITKENPEFKKYIFTNVVINNKLNPEIKGEFDFIIGEKKNNNIEIYKILEAKNSGNSISHDVYLFENGVKYITNNDTKLKINNELYNKVINEKILKEYLTNSAFDNEKFINIEILNYLTEFIEENLYLFSSDFKLKILKNIFFDPTIDTEYMFFLNFKNIFKDTDKNTLEILELFILKYKLNVTELKKNIKILKNYEIRYCKFN
jgi:archaellum component FlaC